MRAGAEPGEQIGESVSGREVEVEEDYVDGFGGQHAPGLGWAARHEECKAVPLQQHLGGGQHVGVVIDEQDPCGFA